MEIDTRKDKSLCQVLNCPNRAVVWETMLRQDCPVSEGPFILVGFCKKHVERAKKAQMAKHDCPGEHLFTVENRGDGWYLYSNGRGAQPIRFCPYCGKRLNGSLTFKDKGGSKHGAGERG